MAATVPRAATTAAGPGLPPPIARPITTICRPPPAALTTTSRSDGGTGNGTGARAVHPLAPALVVCPLGGVTAGCFRLLGLVGNTGRFGRGTCGGPGMGGESAGRQQSGGMGGSREGLEGGCARLPGKLDRAGRHPAVAPSADRDPCRAAPLAPGLHPPPHQ